MGEGRAAPASPLAVPPFASFPRLRRPAPPSREELSLLLARLQALSPLSLPLQQVRALGRRAGAGKPSLGFLAAASLLLGVRAFRCFYSAPEKIPRLSSLGASLSPPAGPPPSWNCRLGSECGNDVRFGGSKFFMCLGGPPFFFLGNQIVLILLISKSEAAAGETNALFPLDSKNLFNFLFSFLKRETMD